jgi:predicted dinucleotide-utilizing enzyme
MATTAAHPTPPRRRRVGVVGFGQLGQFLVDRIVNDPAGRQAFELAFVWNRSPERVASCGLVPPAAVCRDLAGVGAFAPDVIVEVCHPDVLRQHGAAWLRLADVYMGSPTGFADPATECALRAAAAAGPHGLYVPTGALWGAGDIARMADRGTLRALCVTMKKHPASLKLEGPLGDAVAALLAAGTPGESVLYRGPVRGLCPLAPNNVNTMAAAAIAGHSLGFDGTVAVLVSDPSLQAHVITVDVTGPAAADGSGAVFRVVTERANPAPPGAVTGAATFVSFFSSLFAAAGRGPGVHLC